MTGHRRVCGPGRILLLAVCCVWPWAGCGSEKRVEPAVVANERLGSAGVAVAPAVNLSGSADFDPAKLADVMASELSYAAGISVIPVSRVLAMLAAGGFDGVQSPSHALELANAVGADALLVFAVTEYDPYTPPAIGIAAQLYGQRPGRGVGALDAVALSRQAGLGQAPAPKPRRGLLAQTQRVFDASHEYVVEDIKKFAAQRSADRTPYGWRRYVVSQQDFFRYCCHATIRELLQHDGEEVQAGAESERVGMP